MVVFFSKSNQKWFKYSVCGAYPGWLVNTTYVKIFGTTVNKGVVDGGEGDSLTRQVRYNNMFSLVITK